MSKPHGIAWLNIPGYKGESWNPVTGCTKTSAGCANCFAERVSERFGLPWGKPVLHDERIDRPTRWKKPRAIFVCSMSDLFHPDVPGKFINQVWMQIRNNPRHRFIILTKRPKSLLAWTKAKAEYCYWSVGDIWPDNAYIGISAENQDAADDRFPALMALDCPNRIVSVEPMLGPVDLTNVDPGHDEGLQSGFDVLRGCMNGQGESDQSPDLRLRWVICGGESGPGARPMDPDWARSLRDQCQTAGIPFFMKQMSQFGGANKNNIPEDLQIREFPIRRS